MNTNTSDDKCQLMLLMTYNYAMMGNITEIDRFYMLLIIAKAAITK